MSVFKFRGPEEAAATLVGSSSDIGGAVFVRAINTGSGTSTALVSMVDADDVDIGSTTLGPGEVMYLNKRPSDKLFAAAITVLFTPLDPPRG